MGFIHITYLMQRQVSKLEAFLFPYGPLSLSADTTVSLGYVKTNIYHTLKGADPFSETAGAKSIHTESFGDVSSVKSQIFAWGLRALTVVADVFGV